MMVKLDDRDTQTKVKHEILADYLIKWGSIITSGLKGHYAGNPGLRPKFRARFVYVDYFSYMGAYLENGTTVDGSPVLGIKALDEIKQHFITQTSGLVPTITTLLFEENARTYDALLGILEAQGFAERIKRTDDFSTLRDGDIAVINDDSSRYVDRVLKFLDGINPTYSFHFVDPYGTKGMERKNIEKIVSKDHADCIVNMMLNNISRFMGAANKDELNPTEQAYVSSFEKFYGSDVWRDIAQDIASDVITRQQANRQLVDAFDAILHGADSSLTVKQIPLQFQDRDQTLYHLFLTTHDPTGAFAMNKILADARIREYDYRVEKRQMRKQPGQMDLGLFEVVPDEKRPIEPDPDTDLLAKQIYAACQKQTMTFREILQKMASTAFFEEDVREALGKLKQQKRASFDGAPSALRNKSVVKFL